MVMLIPSNGDADKDVVSLLDLAHLQATVNSALALLDLASSLAVVVVAVLLILDLTTVSGSTLVIATIAIMLMLTLMLDSPASKPSVDLLVPSASPVLLTPGALAPKLPSALSTLAAVLEAVLNLPSM